MNIDILAIFQKKLEEIHREWSVIKVRTNREGLGGYGNQE
jgi:hypothetical protein